MNHTNTKDYQQKDLFFNAALTFLPEGMTRFQKTGLGYSCTYRKFIRAHPKLLLPFSLKLLSVVKTII